MSFKCTLAVIGLGVCLFLLPACENPMESSSNLPAEPVGGIYMPPGIPWSLEGKWGVDLTKFQMFQSADCPWNVDDQCGYPGKPACQGVSVLFQAVKITPTTVHISLPFAGLAGSRFEGPIDANNVFEADHESNWSNTYAKGYFDVTLETVFVRVHYNPDAYSCSAEIEFEGVPL